MQALRISSLAFGYGVPRQPVFERLSLALEVGEVVCLVGPSGCGKSTLLNLIAGFLMPDAGSIDHCETEDNKGRLGYIFQSDALLPWRTVEANIGLAAELRRSSMDALKSKIAARLKAFQLEPSILSKYPAELSGGMRQRISLIQCLMADPHLLLLDEPFASIDFFTKLKLEADIRQFTTSEGRSAIFVTHDIEEAIAVGDRVVVMGGGSKGIVAEIPIVLDDRSNLTPEAVRSHPRFGEYFAKVWQELRNAI